MALIETQRTIREWAEASFPDEFAIFDELTKVADFRILQIRVQPDVEHKINVIEVGTIRGKGFPVQAWRDTEIRVGHVMANGDYKVHDDFMHPEIDFAVPFCWIGPTENEVSLARFEAIVRYLLLCHKRNAGMTHDNDSFKDHFKGACLKIAKHVASANSETPMRTRGQISAQRRVQTPIRSPTTTPAQTATDTPTRTRARSSTKTHVQAPNQTLRRTPSEIPMDAPTRSSNVFQTPRVMRSSTPAVSQYSATPNAPALASDLLLRNVDQSTASFRASILAQIGAAQVISRHETSELELRIQELEVQLASAEKDSRDFGTQSTELKTKIEELEAKVLSADRDNEGLEKEATELKAANRDLESGLKTAEKEKVKAENALSNHKAIVGDLKSKLIQLGTAHKRMDMEATELKTKVDDLNSKLSSTNTEKKDLAKETARLKRKANDLGGRLESAKKMKKDSEEEMTQLGTKISDLQSKLQDSQEDKKNVEKKLADMDQTISKSEAKVKEAEAKAEAWRVKYEELRKDVLGAAMKHE